MDMNTMYTSVGHLQLKQDRAGEPYPVVMLNRREHLMKPAELVLWSRLCWRFQDLARLKMEYETAAGQASLPYREPGAACFDYVLARLQARGLIAHGAGDTQVEALYDLLSNLYIAPIDDGFWRRLTAIPKLVLRRRMSCDDAGRLLRKDRPTAQEQRVLTLAKQAMLSTAELIKCEENDVQDVSNGDRVLDALYYDDETTCYNIAHLMRRSPKRDEVVLAVANLYLRKQIVLQRASL